MTLFQLLAEGTKSLELAGDPDASLDARELLLAAFHLDLMKFLMTRMQEIPEDDFHQNGISHYRSMVQKRQRRFPLQQILHSQEFMGYKFYVDQNVLIPRQDTETLVELVLAEERQGETSVLDLCTGSGCIAISLFLKGSYTSITATDLSEAALGVARRNNDSLCDGNIRLLQGDLFDALKQIPETERLFDIITANPPYIPTVVIEELTPEVREHEPRMALDGTADGLHFYRIIAKEAKQYLKDGGSLYLEIGHDQGSDVCQLLFLEGYQGIQIQKDLPGKDRVVSARK